MRKLIELLDDEDHKFLQLWADANVAVFSSALLVGLFRKIANLLFDDPNLVRLQTQPAQPVSHDRVRQQPIPSRQCIHGKALHLLREAALFSRHPSLARHQQIIPLRLPPRFDALVSFRSYQAPSHLSLLDPDGTGTGGCPFWTDMNHVPGSEARFSTAFG
jgi:hypothetical protein